MTHQMAEPVFCPICLRPADEPKTTRYGHSFCHECIIHHLISSSTSRCPICRRHISAAELEDANHTTTVDQAKQGDADPCVLICILLIAIIEEATLSLSLIERSGDYFAATKETVRDLGRSICRIVAGIERVPDCIEAILSGACLVELAAAAIDMSV